MDIGNRYVVFKEISTKIRVQTRKRKLIPIHVATCSHHRLIQKRLILEMLK